MSTLIAKQTKTFGPRFISKWGKNASLTVTVRYDDDCGNGHNSFAITGEIRIGNRIEACGMLHDDIGRVFPELIPFFKWHLCASDGPMHYISNTLYWLGYSGWCTGEPNSPPNLEYARSSAVWPDMPEEFLAGGNCSKESVTEVLNARLQSTLAEFQVAVESLGFVF